eukprot:scaffold24638_cov69-Phaeocystis_antarctica.AAC.2
MTPSPVGARSETRGCIRSRRGRDRCVERQLGAVDVAGEVGVRRLDPPAGDERDDGCKVFVQQPAHLFVAHHVYTERTAARRARPAHTLCPRLHTPPCAATRGAPPPPRAAVRVGRSPWCSAAALAAAMPPALSAPPTRGRARTEQTAPPPSRRGVRRWLRSYSGWERKSPWAAPTGLVGGIRLSGTGWASELTQPRSSIRLGRPRPAGRQRAVVRAA